MSKKSTGAERLEEAGYPASEYQDLLRFLKRLLKATHPNQVESLLAYANTATELTSIAAAAELLSDITGISTTRQVSRMSGNNMPNDEQLSPEFVADLQKAKDEVFTELNQTHMLKENERGYQVKGNKIYKGITRIAICNTAQHAKEIAKILVEKEHGLLLKAKDKNV